MQNVQLKKFAAVLVPVAAAATALPAHATVDYTGITGAFAPTEIVTGLLAVGAVLAAVYVAWRGIRMVLSMMRG